LDFLKAISNAPATGTESQRIIVLVVMITTILFWVTGSIHGITAAAISAIPIVGLTVTGVLTADDMKSLPWDTLFLVAGGLSLGEALKSTGVLDQYVFHLKTINAPPIIFLLILAYLGMIAANVMSGVASCMLLIPLGMAILPNYQTEVAISVGLSVCATVFLPVSIPSNVVVYSTGFLEQKDFRLGGIIVGLLGPLLAVLMVMLIHR
jgi:sodium-dependent dicarboxylate transporter 2/3/5